MDPTELSRARLLLEAREAAYQEALRTLALLRHAATRLASLERFLRTAGEEGSLREGEEGELALLFPGEGHLALLLAAERRLGLLLEAFRARLSEAERQVREAEARRAAAEHLVAALTEEARKAALGRERQALAEFITQRAHWRD